MDDVIDRLVGWRDQEVEAEVELAQRRGEFGAIIGELRQRYGLGKSAFARQIGLTYLSLHLIETGKVLASPATVEAVLRWAAEKKANESAK